MKKKPCECFQAEGKKKKKHSQFWKVLIKVKSLSNCAKPICLPKCYIGLGQMWVKSHSVVKGRGGGGKVNVIITYMRKILSNLFFMTQFQRLVYLEISWESLLNISNFFLDLKAGCRV